ncbi:vWA domain-containing protein [Patulibacter defluvii]|uniref:vWA domain-containing protein n=1 Tax=Patulibacter defluvii TaxID=3095358 RepID=UPI002A762953|nr:vWA domain-containing protein [Patulibacter sp. DM4]
MRSSPCPDTGSTTDARWRALIAAVLLLLLGLPAVASAASGTISVRPASDRVAGDQSGTGFATADLAGFAPIAFEARRSSGGPWFDLCTVATRGATCRSGPVAYDRYEVREKTAPAGWSTIRQLSFGGADAGAGPLVDYAGSVRVSADDSNPTVVPNAGNTVGNGLFLLRRDNAPMPETCGVGVRLVLDTSGSIGRDAPTYARAAKGFVDALADSPASVRISSFSNVSRPGTTRYAMDDPAQVAAAKQRIDAAYATVTGVTNWEAALQDAVSTDGELVVFLTDGNPTTYGNGSGGGRSRVYLHDLTTAIASANLVKRGGQRIVPVGAGPSVSEINLAAISGPGDYYTASNLSDLDDVLDEVANRLCGARIHVRKLVDDAVGAQAGWRFAARSDDAEVSYDDDNPVSAGSPAETRIDLDRIPAGGATVELDEQPTAAQEKDYAFGAARCQLGGYPEPDAALVGPRQQTLKVQRRQDWYCTYRNERRGSGEPPVVVPPVDPPKPPVVVPPVDPPVVVPPVDPPLVAPGPRAQTVRPQPRPRARLSGPVGCVVPRTVRADVAGERIAKVVFRLNGRTLRTLTKPNAKGRYRIDLRTRRLAYRTHRLTATVTFVSEAKTKAKTLRLAFSRCRPIVVTPKFTG